MTFRFLRIGSLILCVLLAANAAVVLAIAGSSPHEAGSWPGDGYRFWPERSWSSFERRLGSLAGSSRAELGVIARVSYRQGSLPIYSLRFPAFPTDQRPLKVLLVSGVHGTETAGVEALLRFARELEMGRRTRAATDITIVPLANPWAWVYGYRWDGAGEDVNRDFSTGRMQEAAALRAFMRKNGPWDLFLDLHESKKPGYFIYQYLPEEEGLGPQYVRILKSMGRPLENTYREGPFRCIAGS